MSLLNILVLCMYIQQTVSENLLLFFFFFTYVINSFQQFTEGLYDGRKVSKSV
jgi:hypothetical protein